LHLLTLIGNIIIFKKEVFQNIKNRSRQASHNDDVLVVSVVNYVSVQVKKLYFLTHYRVVFILTEIDAVLAYHNPFLQII
jgi:hypothetical protein